MGDLPAPGRRWTRVEYARLIDAGIFADDEPIELVDGQLVVREPRHPPHATATQLAAEALRKAFDRGWHVRVQLPIALDPDSEPEPDVCVVPGVPRDYADEHPTRPALVLEVAFGSLRFDRVVKGGLYARAGIADYWIVNLAEDVLEVYREPAAAAGTPHGWSYRLMHRLGPEAFMTPLAAPAARIAVATLLP